MQRTPLSGQLAETCEITPRHLLTFRGFFFFSTPFHPGKAAQSLCHPLRTINHEMFVCLPSCCSRALQWLVCIAWFILKYNLSSCNYMQTFDPVIIQLTAHRIEESLNQYKSNTFIALKRRTYLESNKGFVIPHEYSLSKYDNKKKNPI